MSSEIANVKCPLCEGQGELSATAIVERLSTPELRKRFDARIAEIAEISGVALGAPNKAFNFHKEVHAWNPALPIWRRSPKE
jgi:hypothetical protein